MIPTVLYVEDEADDVFFMRSAFEREGVRVDFQAAHDGVRAIAYLAGEHPYDDRVRHPVPSFVLLDLNLPLRSGFEVLSWLRQRQEFIALPVVVFSSSGRVEDRARAQQLGATDYLLKPSSGMQFGGVVRTLRDRWLATSP
jgi:CheY-like chemotaxis protein